MESVFAFIRALIAGIMLALAAVFPSCGTAVQESPEDGPSQAVQDAQNQLEQDDLVSTDDFDVETNLTESRFGITYQIPQSWSRQVDDSNQNLVYYYPDNALMVMVAFETMEKEGLAISELEAESFARGLEEGFDHFTRVATTRMTLPYDGRDLIYYEYQGSIAGFEGRYYVYAFLVEDGIITFMYGNSANCNASGVHDLWKVIESVEVNE
ncbi:MAG: hypothetical protein J5804_05635 [Eggerthellaceae bacterium]|nr:hypothetical protein [Eggerthellaceae bacterium]